MPNPPRRLTARARSASRIELDWTAPLSSGGGSVTGYRIEVSPNGRTRWTEVESDTGSRATSYTDAGLDPGTTRYYRVAAINNEGRSDWSNVADATTDIAAPDAPTNLTVVPSGVGGRNELLLTWTRPSSDGGSAITGYRIDVSPNGTSGWTALVANTRSTATRYTHTGLSPSTTRHYRVAAINAEGAGGFSNVVSGTTNVGTPTAPQSLRARADGPSSITISWQAPASDNGSPITGYRIRARVATQASWTTISNNTGSTATTFQHTNLQPVTVYRYQVAAINAVGAGPWSLEAGTSTRAGVPAAPIGLNARVRGTSQIDLSWTAPRNTGGAPILGYRIVVSRDGGTSWRILEGNTGSTRTSFSHRDLQPGTTRHYRVSAINTAGIGAVSSVVHATTLAVAPGPPSRLRATPSGGASGQNQLILTWTRPLSDGGSPVTGYRIQTRRSRTGGWTDLVRNTGSTSTTYTHSGLDPGTTRYYRVAAINSRGTGGFSNEATGATNAGVPSAPQGLAASGDGPTTIALSWSAPANDNGALVTGYRIQARLASQSQWTTIVNNTGTGATTFRHTNLQPVTAWRYRVAAINSVGTGPWSNQAGAATLPDVPSPPTRLTARAIGTSQIDLSWTAPTNTGGALIFGYRVEVSTDAGANWRILVRNTQSTTTAYSHRNLQPASTRFYRVSAINSAGASRASNVARATTEATVPGAPRNLRAQTDGTSEIDLSWQAPTSDGGARVTGYRIEVSEDGGASWQNLVENSRNAGTSYSHTGLAPASTRHYRVSAINRIGTGRASGVASATTDATVPDAPTGLTATATTPNQIDLAWVAPGYDGGAAISGYRIEVSPTGTAWTDLQRNSGSTTTTYSHTGLRPGERRFYRISAINRAGTGTPSAVASAATDDPVERAGRLNTMVLPDVAAAMTSSTFGAIADRIDAVASGMATRWRIEMGSLSSMAARFSEPGAGAGVGGTGRTGASRLFDGASFVLPLGATDAPQAAPAASTIATWGAADFTRLGEPNATALDWKGDLLSFHVGLDMRVRTDVLAGLAASRSSGSFDFTDKTGASPVKGTYRTTMNSVNPYVAWFPDRRGTAVWVSGGFGWGEVEINDERAGLRTAPTTMLTGAGGGSRQLFTSGMSGLKAKAEGWAGQAVVDETAQVDQAVMDLQRGRVALEWTQGYRSAAGTEFALMVEGGGRYDNGAGAEGAGAEVGGGLRFSSARWGITAEGRGRMLVTGREDYEEWGVGAAVQIDPGVRGQGLSMRVSPSYGDASSGLDALWERGVSDHMYGRGSRGRTRVDGEIAYGVEGFQGTPYGGFHLAGDGHRAFSSGFRYDLGSGLGVRIEGTRRESVLGGPRHSVGIRGRLRFR